MKVVKFLLLAYVSIAVADTTFDDPYLDFENLQWNASKQEYQPTSGQITISGPLFVSSNQTPTFNGGIFKNYFPQNLGQFQNMAVVPTIKYKIEVRDMSLSQVTNQSLVLSATCDSYPENVWNQPSYQNCEVTTYSNGSQTGQNNQGSNNPSFSFNGKPGCYQVTFTVLETPSEDDSSQRVSCNEQEQVCRNNFYNLAFPGSDNIPNNYSQWNSSWDSYYNWALNNIAFGVDCYAVNKICSFSRVVYLLPGKQNFEILWGLQYLQPLIQSPPSIISFFGEKEDIPLAVSYPNGTALVYYGNDNQCINDLVGEYNNCIDANSEQQASQAQLTAAEQTLNTFGTCLQASSQADSSQNNFYELSVLVLDEINALINDLNHKIKSINAWIEQYNTQAQSLINNMNSLDAQATQAKNNAQSQQQTCQQQWGCYESPGSDGCSSSPDAPSGICCQGKGCSGGAPGYLAAIASQLNSQLQQIQNQWNSYNSQLSSLNSEYSTKKAKAQEYINDIIIYCNLLNKILNDFISKEKSYLSTLQLDVNNQKKAYESVYKKVEEACGAAFDIPLVETSDGLVAMPVGQLASYGEGS